MKTTALLKITNDNLNKKKFFDSLFLTFLEARKFTIKVMANLVSGEGTLPGL
jgi:hypothetical protein